MGRAQATASFLVSAAVLASVSSASHAADPIKFEFVGKHDDKPLTLHVQKSWKSEEGFAVPDWRPVCTATSAGLLTTWAGA